MVSCRPPSDRGSPAILGCLRRADNSGLSAHGPPAETHSRTALGLIYLQNRRSTAELRPHAYLRLDSPKQARMSSGLLAGNRTAHEERIISGQPERASGGGALAPLSQPGLVSPEMTFSQASTNALSS